MSGEQGTPVGTTARSCLIAICVLLVSLATVGAADVSVRDTGAKGDGVSLDTSAIQQAIDRCTAEGGGNVSFPAGKYVSGTILLKDNVTLRFDEGAVLLGSTNIADYLMVDPFRDGTGSQMGYCFIGAVDVTNVAVTGKGFIDGRGRELLAARPQGNRNRPFLMRFVRSRGIRLQDLSMEGSAAWTVHFSQCRDVLAERLTINSRGLSNNDGIDIDSTQDVRIRDCVIDTGDDAVCLKATSTIPCRNVEITGCKLRSHWGGVKFGTESMANFEDVRISDCEIRDARGGIKMLSVDGARLQNVTVSSVTMSNVTVPLFMRLGARLRSFREGEPPQPVGTISNVVVRNLRGTANSSIGILISGIPGHPVRDVTIEDISIELPGGGNREDARVELEERVNAYPEITMFGNRLPAWGLFARHIHGFTARGVTFTARQPDPRPAIVFDDAENVTLSGWTLPGNGDAEPLLRFESVRAAQVRDFTVGENLRTFMRVGGSSSSGIDLRVNVNASSVVETAAEVPANAVIR